MSRKKKEFNKNGIFQRRFTDLWYESGKTQEQLANDLGVTRPTVVGWSDGKNLPDIESLERITRLFDVSADYLLGLSDTMMPDISLRAAMEYTGLSEEAVNSLHNGFAAHNSLVINSEEHRNKKLQAASDLLQSGAFRAMLDRLIDFSQMAHLISLIEAMLDQHWDYEPSENGESFSFARKEDRENILTAMQCVQQKGRLFQEFSC